MSNDTNRDERPLDELIEAQMLEFRYDRRPLADEPYPFLTFGSTPRRRCRECGCYHGHQPGCPEGY